MPCRDRGWGQWLDDEGFPCSPSGVQNSPGSLPPVNVQGTVLASPSTVWTGQGVYSRTLQAILSGIGMLRGVNQVPTATQFIQAPNQGGYAYGGQVPAGYYPAGGGSNFSGKIQQTIERYPGTVAIIGAVGAALVIGKLAGGSRRRSAY